MDVLPGSREVLDAVVAFRSAVYLRSRRNPENEDEWIRDDLDEAATHAIARRDDGEIVAVARILIGERWSLDRHYAFDYDKGEGVEFGRLGVLQRRCDGRRVLFDLMRAACEYSRSAGRIYAYGFVVRRFRRQLERQNIPLTVLSPPIFPYGEEAVLVRFSLGDLLRYYDERAAT
ncbi:MAG TPA: hypothetical protein VJZ76_12740 [Thermoanaerobaculia bacterium]|nr:hypothetical protein [Thermoanaerobaculia bacterium]